MRIGIDATCWSNWRGFGRFTRSLVSALLEIDRENEYVLFFDSTFSDCANVPALARQVIVRTSVGQAGALSVTGRRTIADMARMSFAVARERLDLFLCPSIDSFFPLVRPVPTVVMIHDVIPETLPRMMLPNRAARWRRRLKVSAALSQATAIATGSERARRQVIDTFGVHEVAVIPYGVADVFHPPSTGAAAARHVLERHGVTSPFLLHVGGAGPNKNIPTLLESFRALLDQPQSADVSLVFVGRRDDDAVYAEAGTIDTLLAHPKLQERVRCLGFLPDAELAPLFQAAAALVLPSLSEGFGLPAIEAVACGAPALVTRESPLPEILGEAALVIDPADGPALTRAMRRILGDEGDACRVAAVKRAGAFSWDTSARAALVLFRVVGAHG
jgi:glycosyltransferase involved in cell wall biosynthesis